MEVVSVLVDLNSSTNNTSMPSITNKSPNVGLQMEPEGSLRLKSISLILSGKKLMICKPQ